MELAVFAALAVSNMAFAQPGTITTVIGAFPLGDGLPAPRASLTRILSIALDSQGRLLIGEPHRIRRVEMDGRMSTVLGTCVSSPPPAGPPRVIRPGDALSLQYMAKGPSGEIYGTHTTGSACASGVILNGIVWRFEPE